MIPRLRTIVLLQALGTLFLFPGLSFADNCRVKDDCWATGGAAAGAAAAAGVLGALASRGLRKDDSDVPETDAAPEADEDAGPESESHEEGFEPPIAEVVGGLMHGIPEEVPAAGFFHALGPALGAFFGGPDTRLTSLDEEWQKGRMGPPSAPFISHAAEIDSFEEARAAEEAEDAERWRQQVEGGGGAPTTEEQFEAEDWKLDEAEKKAAWEEEQRQAEENAQHQREEEDEQNRREWEDENDNH
ncbi:MAG TPA: hypothetical protein VGF24_24765 [Vicinamibacterales bacterium]|jgi:hypothetical protein